jgi:hypothetical protein
MHWRPLLHAFLIPVAQNRRWIGRMTDFTFYGIRPAAWHRAKAKTGKEDGKCTCRWGRSMVHGHAKGGVIIGFYPVMPTDCRRFLVQAAV